MPGHPLITTIHGQGNPDIQQGTPTSQSFTVQATASSTSQSLRSTAKAIQTDSRKARPANRSRSSLHHPINDDTAKAIQTYSRKARPANRYGQGDPDTQQGSPASRANSSLHLHVVRGVSIKTTSETNSSCETKRDSLVVRHQRWIEMQGPEASVVDEMHGIRCYQWRMN